MVVTMLIYKAVCGAIYSLYNLDYIMVVKFCSDI